MDDSPKLGKEDSQTLGVGVDLKNVKKSRTRGGGSRSFVVKKFTRDPRREIEEDRKWRENEGKWHTHGPWKKNGFW